jgi:hypothetical protein
MVNRGGELTFAKEAGAFGRAWQRVIQDLERDAAIRLEVLGLVDLAHASSAEQPDHAIRANMSAWVKRIGHCARRRGRARQVIISCVRW